MRPVAVWGVLVGTAAIVMSAPALADDGHDPALLPAQLSEAAAVRDRTKPLVEKVNRAATNTGDFDDIRTPDSPAFVILGISPTEIQRPGTPKDLAVSLSGFFSDGNVTIPRNLALEFAPFWLFPHEKLSAKQYEQGGLLNLVRTLTISLATKQTTRQTMDGGGVTTDHTDSDIGVGFRSRVFWAGLGTGVACAAEKQAVMDAAANMSKASVVSDEPVKKLEETYKRGSPEYLAAFQALQDQQRSAQALAPALEAAQQALIDKCPDLSFTARGWSADVAGALGWTFPDSIATSQNGDLRAAAGWFTLAYAGELLTGALLGRYNGTQIAGAWQKDFDVGLRLVYKRGELALSGEGIGRWHYAGPGPESTYKLDVAAEYKVAGETWITLTIGRNFDFGAGSSLFGVANVNVGFGKSAKSKARAD